MSRAQRASLLLPAAVLLAGVLLSSMAVGGKKKVTLANGETYKVKMLAGRPAPYRSRQIIVVELGFAILVQPPRENRQLAFQLEAQLFATGRFRVDVTTPLDESQSMTFDWFGPSDLKQPLFGSHDYPRMWKWLQDDGASWVPLRFVFRSESSDETFSFTQWVLADEKVKKKLRIEHRAAQADERLASPNGTPSSKP